MTRLLFNHKLLFIALLLTSCVSNANVNEVCEVPDEFESENIKCGVQSHFSGDRYILYDVNRPEGFNLRRDVYIRVAVFMKDLVEEDKKFKWKLVLPPWGNLYHWRSKDLGPQVQIPWGTFFDIKSLNKYIPVIEMQEFIDEYSQNGKETVLDTVYILQNDEEMFKTGKFKDKNVVKECSKDTLYYKIGTDKYGGDFWGYKNVTAKNIKCVIFHGTISGLTQNLQPSVHRTFMFDHMEIPLHNYYGSQDYWSARRSMRYNSKLYSIANEFREKFLNSTNEWDNTEMSDDWTQQKERRTAIGGPYLCVHLRRRDFVTGRPSLVPSIKQAASQLKRKLDELDLHVLFVATDTTTQEFEELQTHLRGYTVLKFKTSDDVLFEFKDGGIAILDQIICSYARYFVGTDESTFSFRIQEDREIIGFPSETTFNRLCSKNDKCSPTSRWEIVW